MSEVRILSPRPKHHAKQCSVAVAIPQSAPKRDRCVVASRSGENRLMHRRAKPANGQSASVATRAGRDESAKIRELEKRLADARAQQTATSEILRVISRCPADLQPVFDAIVRSASSLCDGMH